MIRREVIVAWVIKWGLASPILVVTVLGVWAAAWWIATAMPMTTEAARKKTSLSLAKFRMFSQLAFHPEEVVPKAYAEGMDLIPGTDQFVIVSAERLWLRPGFKADIPNWFLSDWYLLPEPYLRKHRAQLKDSQRVYREHGAGFEVMTVHTNLLAEVQGFSWSTFPPDTGGANLRFPLMWSKHPELCGGVRYVLDISGWSLNPMPESDFTNYLRGAEAWVRRDAPDAWIDTLLTSDTRGDVHNGITLLLRQSPTNLVSRLGKACEGNNAHSVSDALNVLAQYRTEEAVQALARVCEFQPKSGHARGRAVRLLKNLTKESDAKVRAAADAALEKL
ncbi:MAG: hypothetical protein ACKODH_14145 [Limisphaerales bacterium]